MGFAAGFNAGTQMLDAQSRRSMARAQEERARLEFERKQQDWALEDQNREANRKAIDNALSSIDQGIDPTAANAYLSRISPDQPAVMGTGLVAPQGATPAAAQFMRTNPEIASTMPMGQVEMQPASPGLRLQGNLQFDPGQAELMRANLQLARNDPKLGLGALKDIQAQRERMVEGAIRNAILNASDEQAAQISSRWTDSKTVAGEMKFNPSTGYYTYIPDGGKPIRMSKIEAAEFGAAMHAAERGDPNAYTRMAAINKDLAAQAKDMATRLNSATGTNNQVQRYANQDENDRKRLENDNARLGLERQRLENDKKGKGDFIALENIETGETVQADRRTMGVDKAGLLQLPPGYRFARDTKPIELKPDTVYQDPRTRETYRIGEDGSRVVLGGISPKDLPQHLARMGLSKIDQEMVELAPGGKYLILKSDVAELGPNAPLYPLTDRAAIQKSLAEHKQRAALMAEAQTRGVAAGAVRDGQDPTALGLQLGNPWAGRTSQPGQVSNPASQYGIRAPQQPVPSPYSVLVNRNTGR